MMTYLTEAEKKCNCQGLRFTTAHIDTVNVLRKTMTYSGRLIMMGYTCLNYKLHKFISCVNLVPFLQWDRIVIHSCDV